MNQELIIYSDGAARGNPGPAAIGASLELDGAELATVSQTIGVATNNVAEYLALKAALVKAAELGYKQLAVRADSELMIKQLKREYKVKNPELKKIFGEIQNLLQNFDKVSFSHVRREQNKRADALANQALDF